ncbi:response regulator [Siccirubricoccus sp. KC 17139]|uniref:Response regulator n=1 Tax=Siccirubricoccus soli TaxID=2899147 RepID=A0ABT1D3L2_9PROT|nr:response regulator [Siccirubricoccus soli]MCO6416526.1 response regulator [Siccirubricoccus soli]MCP2682660.1 response regulator [Siccirubricoccus soli]
MSHSPLVAVVDDDETIREALSDLLRALGLECRSFHQAEAFLAAYFPGRFDGLITDIRMPGIGGLELLRRIKVLAPPMPVIVITSFADPAIHRAAMDHGALASITKPLTSDDLILLLKALGQDGGTGREGG